MSTTSRASGRSPSRNLPFTLHVSVYAIVPLALAFLASAFIWDIFCFNCDRQQEWRAAVPETAKVRNPNAPAGVAASKAIQVTTRMPLPTLAHVQPPLPPGGPWVWCNDSITLWHDYCPTRGVTFVNLQNSTWL